MWLSMRSELWYWKVVVVMLRKVVLSLLLSLLPYQSVLVALGTSVVLFASILLHLVYLPYEHKLDNVLETVVLSLSFLFFMANSSLHELVRILVTVSEAVLVCYLAVIYGKKGVRSVRARWMRRHHITAMEDSHAELLDDDDDEQKIEELPVEVSATVQSDEADRTIPLLSEPPHDPVV
jgi:signal transduction histidine kinase